jgi:predicted dehydrogenase
MLILYKVKLEKEETLLVDLLKTNIPVLKIGIVGGGKNIDRSIEQIRKVADCEFQGYFDATSSASRNKKFNQLEDLMGEADAFCVLNPIANMEQTEILLRNQKHCLIESPFAPSSKAGSHIIELVREADVKIHISNPKRYNDAFYNTSPYFRSPIFIESRSLQPYSKETKNLSLVMSLMIHDIDIILNVVKSPVKSVTANGVAVVSKEPDIISARIEFDNGCIANLTASRINSEINHEASFYQQNDFINVDYLNKTSEVFDLGSRKTKRKGELLNNVFSFDAKINEQAPKLKSYPNEVQSFVDSIMNNTPAISMANCLNALEIAYAIEEKIERSFA